MAADTVIVDVPSLESAISSFTQCSTAIGQSAAQLQTNASQIREAWESQASNTYQGKMAALVQNVQNAQTALQNEIKELETYCDRSKAAEKTSQSIADSITDTGFMA